MTVHIYSLQLYTCFKTLMVTYVCAFSFSSKKLGVNFIRYHHPFIHTVYFQIVYLNFQTFNSFRKVYNTMTFIHTTIIWLIFVSVIAAKTDKLKFSPEIYKGTYILIRSTLIKDNLSKLLLSRGVWGKWNFLCTWHKCSSPFTN